MPSSGMFHRVALVRTNISEELSASITLMMEALSSSKTSVLKATQHDIQQDGILHSHRRENLKSYFVSSSF
jgi:hypothetical protein